MNARDLKNKYIEFFVSKGHVEIPSASLLPENDPTTLFISAGMQPLIPYFTGRKHPSGNKITDIQKCVRTGDIDEVGDTTHHTFFEQLGNWSLGDYFKAEALNWSYEFITKYLNLDHTRLSVTCFVGDNDSPKDTVSAEIWEKLGLSKDKIRFLPKADNWWGPAGAIGPCGPDSEMFIDGIEIWNDVFLEFNKNPDGSFSKLPQHNVDTGMGVERTMTVLNGLSDNYLTTIWQPIIKKIEQISGKKYSDDVKAFRIIADHLRTAVFMIADGVEPSNKEAGYVLRRIIRRSIRQGKLLGIEQNFCVEIAQAVMENQDNYAGIYPELNQNSVKIYEQISNEEIKFRKTLNNGLREIQKLIDRQKSVSGSEAFDLYQSFGFPVEMIQEELNRHNLTLDIVEFNTKKEAHQKQSQTLSAGKFKSGLADHSEIITKYHTATHLLHQSLRKILGDHVQQSGSNITSDRLRFDFSHPDKLSEEQVKAVETMVNDQIKAAHLVTMETVKFVDAQKSGALAFFGTKYPETVSVYTVGTFSKEVCTGPHVDNTNVLGHFHITKEESAGSGKRRIYAVLS